MNKKDIAKKLDKKEMKAYAKEAEERWGQTVAYKESQERVKKMNKSEMKKIQEYGEALTADIAKNMDKGFNSKEVQTLIAKHYNALRKFYEPNPELYRGLANMYLDDPRFSAYYDKYEKGLANFMKDAMIYFVDNL